MIEINNNQEFHLSNKYISYVFRVMEKTNILEQLYYGKKINHYDNFDFLIEREIRTGNNFIEDDYTTSFEHIKQEMPVYGTSDFRYPGIDLTYENGDNIAHFEFIDYKISKGREKKRGFPRTFAKDTELEILTIILKDKYSDLILELDYGLYIDIPVISRQARLINNNEFEIELNQLMSLSLDFPNEHFEWLHLDGAWARERHVKRNKIQPGVQHISSTRGASGHMYNPFLAIIAPDTSENKGVAVGISLIYSGNFLAQIECDNFDILRIQIGINPFKFLWVLKPNEVFETPEAVIVYSDLGLNGMSQTFHNLFTNHLINQKWKKQLSPILINNWEATYFNFNEDKILEIANSAKNIGIEMFVLDDGWFGSRDSDYGSLGNWSVDRKKLPSGIKGLVNKIHGIGMKFGLWFEPEMVSKDTSLYKNHPEWIIGNPKKNISHGRNQYVLNFADPAVVENIFNQIDAILTEGKIDYIKWDMNRYISEIYAQGWEKKFQGEVFHRYILGVYELYERIIEKYPNILIESCAGGGGRFDPAMLYYAPQTWASDNTDAIERIKIQYGTSIVYPISSIGSHISEIPNHQVGRETTLKIRSDVALFGTYGFELDITKLSSNELFEIKEYILEYKKFRRLIKNGVFFRLHSPFEDNITSWMVVGDNQSEALVGIYQTLAIPNDKYHRIKLTGLIPNRKYRYTLHNMEYERYGSDLESIGLILGGNFIDNASGYWSQLPKGDFYSQLIHLQLI
ncbi:alpha-galactosidase [Aerococcaceae bacterium zg-BR22]|uniref:alpha-galactosidase n=1 Tax=Aerococcaceae bacterium zg-1292 TaxID=2774330 RepID=UPI00406380F9|nr:alpha-galactosidase [Aerococcaceae bacterium zg-BR22]